MRLTVCMRCPRVPFTPHHVHYYFRELCIIYLFYKIKKMHSSMGCTFFVLFKITVQSNKRCQGLGTVHPAASFCARRRCHLCRTTRRRQRQWWRRRRYGTSNKRRMHCYCDNTDKQRWWQWWRDGNNGSISKNSYCSSCCDDGIGKPATWRL